MESVMAWDHQVGGCFGNMDKMFATHPPDEDRAFEWLKSLRERGIGWEAVRAQIEEYLKAEGCGPDHIAEQIMRAEVKFRPWLLD